MKELDYTQIIITLIGVLATIVTGFLIPLLKSKLDISSYNKVLDYANVGVKAAEQLFASDAGKEKLEYVKQYLADNNIKVDIAAIEAAVKQNFGKESVFQEMLTRPPDETEKITEDYEV